MPGLQVRERHRTSSSEEGIGGLALRTTENVKKIGLSSPWLDVVRALTVAGKIGFSPVADSKLYGEGVALQYRRAVSENELLRRKN